MDLLHTSHGTIQGLQGGTPPYVVALIEMEEGVKMMSNVVDVDPNEVFIGMDVQVVFNDVTDEVTLPKFKPAG